MRFIDHDRALIAGVQAMGIDILHDHVDTSGGAAQIANGGPGVERFALPIPDTAQHQHPFAQCQLRMMNDAVVQIIGVDDVTFKPEGIAQKGDSGGRIGIAQAWNDGGTGDCPLLAIVAGG